MHEKGKVLSSFSFSCAICFELLKSESQIKVPIIYYVHRTMKVNIRQDINGGLHLAGALIKHSIEGIAPLRH